MNRVLIVANQTAGGQHLLDEVSRRAATGPHEFTLLVPATKPHGTMTWTEGEARAAAQRRMEAAVEALRNIDVTVEGVVGIESPMDAVMDAVRTHSFDEIIISTLPRSLSRWLGIDLPHRVERRTGLPVTHIEASSKDAHHAA